MNASTCRFRGACRSAMAPPQPARGGVRPRPVGSGARVGTERRSWRLRRSSGSASPSACAPVPARLSLRCNHGFAGSARLSDLHRPTARAAVGSESDPNDERSGRIAHGVTGTVPGDHRPRAGARSAIRSLRSRSTPRGRGCRVVPVHRVPPVWTVGPEEAPWRGRVGGPNRQCGEIHWYTTVWVLRAPVADGSKVRPSAAPARAGTTTSPSSPPPA